MASIDMREACLAVDSTSQDVLSGNEGDLHNLLDEAIGKLQELGEEFSCHRERLQALKERSEGGRLHLAVLGQFKRGKSTLLNAFLGQRLLPTSVVPLTAVPTFLEFGPHLQIRIRGEDGNDIMELDNLSTEEAREVLDSYVTEEGNPKNRVGVRQVDITHPASLLRHGVVLIDTPGIGSTFTHNTDATLSFLPQCDAALFVVSPDPPLTEVEADFLSQVASTTVRLFFVFNKIDYLDEEDREQAVAFLVKTLREKMGRDKDYPLFCVSAKRALRAREAGDDEKWNASGLGEVEDLLVRFLATEKASALREALSRKASDALEQTLMRLRLSLKSLRMPLEDLERRLDVFGRELKRAERDRLAVQDLLEGDRKRTIERLEKEAEELRVRSSEHLKRVIEASFSAMEAGSNVSEQQILDKLADEVSAFFQSSAEDVSRSFGTSGGDLLRPYQQQADDLVELIRRTAAQLFEIPYHSLDASTVFEEKRRPYWVLRKRVPTLPIVVPEEALDKLLPRKMRMSRLRKRLTRQMDTLVRHNVENLRWATLQNLNDAFHRFSRALDRRFQETISATHGAIEAAYHRRVERSEAIADEVMRLEQAATGLAALVQKLRNLASSEE